MSSRLTYNSFLLRAWKTADGALRVEVEHVQSHSTARFASLAEAEQWLAERMGPRAAGDLVRHDDDLSRRDEELPAQLGDQGASPRLPDDGLPPRAARPPRPPTDYPAEGGPCAPEEPPQGVR